MYIYLTTDLNVTKNFHCRVVNENVFSLTHNFKDIYYTLINLQEVVHTNLGESFPNGISIDSLKYMVINLDYYNGVLLFSRPYIVNEILRYLQWYLKSFCADAVEKSIRIMDALLIKLFL